MQGSTLQQPDGVPMQPKQLSHMECGKTLASLNDRLCQTPRHAGIAIEPTDRLHAFATVTTPDTAKQNAEAHSSAKDGQIADNSLAILMRG